MTLPIFPGFLALPPEGRPTVGMNIAPEGYAGACVLEEMREHYSHFRRTWTMVLTWRLTCAECGDQFRIRTGLHSTRIGPRCRRCWMESADSPRLRAIRAHMRECDEQHLPNLFYIFDKEERLTYMGEPVKAEWLAKAWVCAADGFRRPTARDTMGYRTPVRSPPRTENDRREALRRALADGLRGEEGRDGEDCLRMADRVLTILDRHDRQRRAR